MVSQSNRAFIRIAWLISALGVSGSAFAIPASPHWYSVKQPDGTVISVRMRGDEFFHWEEDANGYTVVRNDTGVYFFAALDQQFKLVPTSLKAGFDDPAAAGLKPGILPPLEIRRQKRIEHQAILDQGHRQSAALRPPGTGTVKNIVILLRFSNHLTRPLPSPADMDIVFNNVGTHALAPTGSVRDLYLENSYGQLTIDSTVFAWVNVPQTEQYYANGNSGLGTRIWQALSSALSAVDSSVNFSQFDEDGDGYVDAIAFVHSGYGAEWGGTDVDGTPSSSRIWSHRWSMPDWVSAEGVRVSDYHINPGLWGTSGSAPGRIGVIAHETGHFFGLPDLYDTDGGGEGAGSYCMMANSWGFDGSQLRPPHFSAWSKIELGWLTPTILSTAGTYSAQRVEEFAQVYRVNSGFPNGEYLLIENRQPFGFENILPQGGLCIWHIDDAKFGNTDQGYPGQPGWPGNNNHYQVALLQADGQYHLERGGFGRGDGGDVFHGSGVAEISDETVPDTRAYQGGNVFPTLNRIENISFSSPTMTFDYSPACSSNIDCQSSAACSVSVCNSGQCQTSTAWSVRDSSPVQYGASDHAEQDQFGSTVAASGDRFIVGAFGNDCSLSDVDCGAAYVFRRTGTESWIQEQKLIPSNANDSDWFGTSVAMDGNVAALGSWRKECAAGEECGAVAVFRFDGSTWNEEAIIISDDLAEFDFFGHAVSLSGELLFVGAPSARCFPLGPYCGAIYVFRHTGGTWVQEAKILPPYPETQHGLGLSVSAHGDRVAAGLPNTNCANGNEWCGAVMLFRHDGTNWIEETTLLPTADDRDAEDHFGESVSLKEGVLAVGTGYDDCESMGPDCGAGYVFRLVPGDVWLQEAKLVPASANAGDRFGQSIALDGDLVALGGHGKECSFGGSQFCGASTVFQLKNSGWLEEASPAPSFPAGGERFGISVSLNGEVMVVGANGNDVQGQGSGASYALTLFADCNDNDVVDTCDLLDCAGDASCRDCNNNNKLDACEGPLPDCNDNTIADGCDITDGTSQDVNPQNGVPDECEVAAVLPDPSGINKVRYISFRVPGSGGAAQSTALQVKMVELMNPQPPNLPQFPPFDYSAFEGQFRYVGQSATCQETEAPSTAFHCATLQCQPHYQDWGTSPGGQPLHVAGTEIIPSSMYEVRQLAQSCAGNESNCALVSIPLVIKTIRWGDVTAPFQQTGGALNQPNINDVAAAVDKFKGLEGALIVARGDIHPGTVNMVVNIADVAGIVDAFKNLAYPFPITSNCP